MTERFNQLVERYQNIVEQLSSTDRSNLKDARAAAEQTMGAADPDGDDVRHVLDEFEDALKELEDQILPKTQPVPTPPPTEKIETRQETQPVVPVSTVAEQPSDNKALPAPTSGETNHRAVMGEAKPMPAIPEQWHAELEKVRESVFLREFERANHLLNNLQQNALTPESLAIIEKERQATQQAQRDVFNKYLGFIDEELQRGAFVNAEKWLASAKQYVLDDAHQTAIQTREQSISRNREGDLEQLREKIEKALKDVRDNQTSLPEDISTWVDQYNSLAQGRDKGNTVQKWHEQIRDIKNQSGVEKVIRDAERECIALWHEGGVPKAKEALDLIEKLENEYKALPEISKLKERAKTEHDNARKFAKEAVTSAVTGRFEELIADYEEKQKSGVKYVPRLKLLKDDLGNFTTTDGVIDKEGDVSEFEAVNIDEAIPELRSFARTYARQKAEEKLEQAKTILAQNPRQAAEFLDEAENLYLLAEEEKQKVKHYRQTTVNPAVKWREEAEKLRDGAEALDIFAGWQQLQEAIRTDLLVPGVAGVQERLRPRLRKRIEDELGSLRRQLQAIPRSLLGQTQAQQQHQEAIAQTTAWVTLAVTDAQLADLAASLDQFIKESQRAIDDYQYVAAQVEAITENLKQENFSRAAENFAQVKNRLGEEGIKAYPQLLGIQTTLESRGNIDAVVMRIEANLGGTEEQLIQYVRDLEGALTGAGNHLQLAPLLRKVRSRLNYRRGRTAFERKQYAEARPLLEGVDSDDREEARKLLKILEDAEYERERLEKVLGQAERNQEAGLWQQAYQLLQPWQDKPRPDQLDDRFHRLYRMVKEGWEQATEQHLHELRHQTPLQPKAIKEQLEALEILGSRTLPTWRRDALAPCYDQSAREKRRKGKLRDSIDDWNEALHYDPDNEKYRESLLEVEKENVRQQVAAAPHNLLMAEQLYKNLRLRYSDDPDIRLQLADIYLRQGQFEATDMELGWLNARFSQSDFPDEPAWSAKRDEIQTRLRQEQKIYQVKRTLATHLQASREISEYKLARSRYEELRTEFPQASHLTAWWDEQVNRLATELQAQTEAMVKTGKKLWEAAAPALKILVLHPHNGYARDLIAQLAHQVLGLDATVDELLRDTVGPYDVAPEAALDKQIETTEQRLKEVGSYLFALSQHINQEAGSQNNQNTLQNLRTRLDERLRQLKNIQSELHLGRSQLDRARSSGKWDNVDLIASRLNQDRLFAGHHTVALFLRDLAEARSTRQQLEEKVAELREALQTEAFTQAQQIMIDLQALDEADAYNVREKQQLKTSLRPRPIPFSQLEELLTTHLEDLKALYRWLFPVLKVAPWFDPVISGGTPPDGDLAQLNEQLQQWLSKPLVVSKDEADARDLWKQTARYVKSVIRTYTWQGQFDQAQKLCKDVLGDDGASQMTIAPFGSYYTLVYLYNHLDKQPPLQTPDLQSTHSRQALKLARDCRERIQEQLSDARQEQANLSRDEADFHRILKQLRDKVDQYERTRFFGKGEIQSQGLALYGQAYKLCPNNKMLARLRAQLLSK